MILFSRLMFALLGMCALAFAWNFAMTFSKLLIANDISTVFMTSILFSFTSVAAALVAFHAMRNAPKLKSKERLVFVIMYVLILLPSIVTVVALNQQVAA